MCAHTGRGYFSLPPKQQQKHLPGTFPPTCCTTSQHGAQALKNIPLSPPSLQAQHNLALAEDMEEDDGELTEEQATDLAAIRARKKQIVADHRCGGGGREGALSMTLQW